MPNPSMLSCVATLIAVFTVPASDKYPASWKIQLLGDNALKDGQYRKDLVTLSVPQEVHDKLDTHIGETVTVPISCFSEKPVNYFYPKGSGLSGVSVQKSRQSGTNTSTGK